MNRVLQLFRRYVSVKPIALYPSVDAKVLWLTTTESAIEAFFDEIFRYNVRTAFYNLRWHWNNPIPKDDEASDENTA